MHTKTLFLCFCYTFSLFRHQQLCVNFLSGSQFCCVDDLKSASPRALSMLLDRAISKLSFELGIIPESENK